MNSLFFVSWYTTVTTCGAWIDVIKKPDFNMTNRTRLRLFFASFGVSGIYKTLQAFRVQKPRYCHLFGTTCCRERGEGGGRGAESYDRKKAWSSINHSILSDSLTNIVEKQCSGSVPVWYGSGSCSSLQWLPRCQQKISFFLICFAYKFL